MLTKEEVEEFKMMAKSLAFRADMQILAARQEAVDVDTFVVFLDQYNKFVNHTPKLFSRIIDKNMKL